jgi:hypothetical protein
VAILAEVCYFDSMVRRNPGNWLMLCPVLPSLAGGGLLSTRKSDPASRHKCAAQIESFCTVQSSTQTVTKCQRDHTISLFGELETWLHANGTRQSRRQCRQLPQPQQNLGSGCAMTLPGKMLGAPWASIESSRVQIVVHIHAAFTRRRYYFALPFRYLSNIAPFL